MPAHRPKSAIAKVLRYAWIVEDRSLHDTGGEDYLIASWVVVRLRVSATRTLSGATRARSLRSRTLTVSAVIPHSSRFVGLPRADHSRSMANLTMETAFSKKAMLEILTSA